MPSTYTITWILQQQNYVKSKEILFKKFYLIIIERNFLTFSRELKINLYPIILRVFNSLLNYFTWTNLYIFKTIQLLIFFYYNKTSLKKTLKTFNNKTELVTSSYSYFCYNINKMADRTEIIPEQKITATFNTENIIKTTCEILQVVVWTHWLG